MATTKLKAGIVGVGGIANGKHLPSLAKNPNVEIVAFCDLIKERAEAGAKQYGAPGAKVFTDFNDLISLPEIDVVYVLTTNNAHAPATIAALEAGKHVMCEKPMAINSVEARAMVDAAKKSGKKLTIGYQNRYRPDSLHLKTITSNNELGEVYFAKALAVRRRAVPTWGSFLSEEKQGGGPLIDIGTHALDLTLWLMDNYKPKYVVGNTYHKLGSKENAANAWGSWDPKEFTVEDSAFGFITMENGATITLEASWALNTLTVGEAITQLCGTEGGADMFDGLRINGEKYSKMYTIKPDLGGQGVAFNDALSGDDPAQVECNHFIDCIINDKEPMVKPEQAFVVTQILEAIYESANSGKPVFLNN